MPGPKLPDNWEEDTRFDGPEYWGMDDRWKPLFRKDGARSGYASSISSRNYSSGESESGDVACDIAQEDTEGVEKTVDISQDDDFDDDDDDSDYIGMLSSGGDDRNASARLRAARTNIPQTATEEREGQEWRISSPNRRRNTNSTREASASKGKGRKGEERTADRRWRHGAKTTEPASSSKANWSVSDAPLYSTSEEEEEFDETEANILGLERPPPSTTPVQLRQNHDRAAADSSSSSSKKETGGRDGRGVPTAGEGRGLGGAASSPLACDGSSDDSPLGISSRSKGEEDIESSGSDSDGSDAGSGNDRYYTGGNTINSNRSGGGGGGSAGQRGSKAPGGRRRSNLFDFGERDASTNDDRGQGKRQNQKGITVIRERGGGKRSNESRHSSHKSSSSTRSEALGSASVDPASAGGQAEGGAGKHLAPPGVKRARKPVRARGDNQGWLSGGGGRGGRARTPGTASRDPVSSFQGSQFAAQKNNDRRLTQSKLKFAIRVDD